MDKQVVIARFNEDLTWTEELNCPFLIYNKGDPFPPDGQYDRCSFPLPNIGREAHTYLFHIVNMYNGTGAAGLARTTFFVQGDPFPHTRQFELIKYINGFRLEEEEELLRTYKGFRPFGRRTVCNKLGAPHYTLGELPFEFIWKQMFPDEPPCPNTFTFTMGALFCTHKKNILRRPKLWYERALALTHCTTPYLGVYHRWYAHLLERTWPLIFKGRGEPI